MLKLMVALLLLTVALAPTPASAQSSCNGALTWTGITPDCLPDGESYRILFITSGERDATSSNIADYNNFVQAQADANTLLNGVTFNVLGSTDTVDARDNTNSNLNSDGAGEPIFYYLGRKAADNYADFYDTNWDTAEARDQQGQTFNDGSTGTLIWTGTTNAGTKAGNSPLGGTPGNPAAFYGFRSAGNLRLAFLPQATTVRYHFYALSDVLLVGMPMVSGTYTASVNEGNALPTALSSLITDEGQDPATVAYRLVAGTTLPPGLDLNTDGSFTGTVSFTATTAASSPQAFPFQWTYTDGRSTTDPQPGTITVTDISGPTATLAGTVTEANLFAATAPTVTVILTSTTYAATGTLMQSHFTVTDTVAGTVSVSGFTRDSDTVATLTLAYSGEDITTAGTLTVALAAAGHTGPDDLVTDTIAITASTGTNICGRTEQVVAGIVAVSSASECTSITDLATITTLDLRSDGITVLQNGDFAGLAELTTLRFNSNNLRTLPPDVFDGLSALEELNLFDNNLNILPVDVFDGLTSVQSLFINMNEFTSLPVGIFNGLAALVNLALHSNPSFTPGTGLPAGIFDDVLDTLGPVPDTLGSNGLSVAPIGRDAHFVCSRPDADAIVAVIATVSDCLRISSSQLATAIPLVTDATLSTLTISEGRLDPAFDPAATTYTVAVDSSVTSVRVTPTATRSAATITVNNVAVTSGNASNDINLMLALGMEVPITIEVTAADTTTMLTYTVTVTRAPTATLTGTLTEVALFSSTAPTVTVTLINTEYAAPGTLMPSDFSVTDTVDGTVRVSDVTRDTDTVATLTLAYSGEDITTTGTLSVILAAAGHTGTDDLMTSTIAITASAGTNICGRTAQVRDEIVRVSSATECTSITDLASITRLDLSTESIASLQPGDFAGLTALQRLDLDNNDLEALPANIFDGLPALLILGLDDNDLEALPATIFVGLTALQELDLSANSLSSLDATIFVGLPALLILGLGDNDLEALPANIFVGLTALQELDLSANSLSSLDANIFVGLTALGRLRLDRNDLEALPATIFAGLSALEILFLNNNDLEALPATIFDGLERLSGLRLFANPFTADTGLPAGIFDDVLDTLGAIGFSGFAIDQTVRRAHFVCSRADADAIVAATAGVDDCLRVTSAQFDALMRGVATLAGTLTEANLFAATPPTVTVTLANTEYAAPGTLMPSHFSVTDTVDGTVSVSDVTRDSDTVATLTLAYSGEDITTTGTLSVILAAAGHTGADDLMTSTIAITASAGANVCGRTPQVRDAIVRVSSATECTSITDLATITSFDFPDLNTQSIASLQPGDFAGLTALQLLDLRSNALEALPATIFDGLEMLRALRLFGNPFTANTGLPAGIFDDVLDTLGPITTNEFSGFLIDQTVRDAHFVCSRADAAAIVMATTGVTDCLRISTAQLNAALPLVTDATLSGLTLSDGTDLFPLTPVFASGTTAYTVAVANSVTSVMVTPTATRSVATITVNNVAVTSGNASNDINLTLALGMDVPITIEVTAADTTTMLTYTVTVTRAPNATLTGTLTEVALLSSTAPTVTVTLINTEYAATDTLAQSHFTVTDTVDGTVSVSDVTRDSDTVATLTLAYSGEDITTTGTLSVILAAAGHTGADDLMTSTIAITASAGANVCGRTPQVRDAIVRVSSATECTSITDLANISILDLNRLNIASLQPGDFAGLTALRELDLLSNDLEALPATIFAGLSALQVLDLTNNDLDALPATIFDGLSALQRLNLNFNALETLPATIFDGLTRLQRVELGNNDLAALPATIFAGLTALGRLGLDRNALEALPATIFAGLSALEILFLNNNDLEALPATIFDGLERLSRLRLFANPFTADTGLPAGIFDDVLDTLGAIRFSGFAIDQTVRRAHFVCSRPDADAIVAATAGVDDCLRVTSAQFNAFMRGFATLAGTLTEASLFSPTAPTVTVTLVNSEYAAPGTLLPSHFSLRDTVVGTVRVSDVTRDSATEATLTLAYSGEDIAIDGTLFVILAAAGHTGVGDLITDTIEITAGAGGSADVCGRTAAVRDEIVEESSATECTNITDLASLIRLDLSGQSIASLQPGDFAGLTGLQDLFLDGNALEALPATIFDGLGSLRRLRIFSNPFTADTGLPAGIFDDVLDTLRPVTTNRFVNGFEIDQVVRDAHFVCSRDDADAIVAATAGVTDCLRISTAQLNAYLAARGAILAGPLTEANLFAATAPTVTVTLANTAYETPGTLIPRHFSVTDTVAGTVRVIGFTLDSATVATLTLVYNNEDITTDGTLSVTVAAAGHTGTDDLVTNFIFITASVGVNICGRTAKVRDRIVRSSSATECTSITDLATITELDLSFTFEILRLAVYASLRCKKTTWLA